MINVIKGKVIGKKNRYILVLTSSGLGFKIYTTDKVIETSELNTELIFHCHHYLRENREDLYGFSSIDELEYFEMLIEVNGVGPSTALDIVSFYTWNDFENIIKNSEISCLTKVKGIGSKIAKRIIIELSSKIESKDDLIKLDSGTKNNPKIKEIYDVLSKLGFKTNEIKKMTEKIRYEEIENISVEELVTLALKNNE